MKKFVFFIETAAPLSGVQLSIFDMAEKIAAEPLCESYFINNYFEKDETICAEKQINYIPLDDADFSAFSDALFVVPVNYLPFVLKYIHDLPNVKLCCLYYDKTCLNRLIGRLYKKDTGDELINLLSSTASEMFINGSIYFSVNKDVKNIFSNNNIVNYNFINEYALKKQAKEIKNNKRFNIAYYGPVNSKTLWILLNLEMNLIRSNSDMLIDLHIVKSPLSNLSINFEQSSPNFRYIFTAPGDVESCIDYLCDNADIVIASGQHAIDTAAAGNPVYVPVTEYTQFYFDRYIPINDLKMYGYSINAKQARDCDIETFTMTDICNSLLDLTSREEFALLCKNSIISDIEGNKYAALLERIYDNTTLTVEKCMNIPEINDYVIEDEAEAEAEYEAEAEDETEVEDELEVEDESEVEDEE